MAATSVFELVNAAYALESDPSSPVCFKRAPRFNALSEVEELLARCEREPSECAFFIATPSEERATATVERWQETASISKQQLLGVIFVERRSAEDATFGPFAVANEAKGSGIGSALLLAAERFSLDVLRAQRLIADVVNHRTDLLGFYEHRGFTRIGQTPCDAAHNCDFSKLTRPSFMLSLAKPL